MSFGISDGIPYAKIHLHNNMKCQTKMQFHYVSPDYSMTF